MKYQKIIADMSGFYMVCDSAISAGSDYKFLVRQKNMTC